MYVLKLKEEEKYFRKRSSYSGGLSIADSVERASFYTSIGKAYQSIESPTSKFYLKDIGYSPNDFIVREVEIRLK